MVPVSMLPMYRMQTLYTLNITGKSTLAKILLRIIEFDEGLLQVNGVDIRRYNPDDYHRHLTAVFQNFSKFNFSAKKNVGLGNVEKLGSRPAIEKAIQLAEANAIIESLPHGLRTILDTPGFESVSYPGMPSSSQHHGLSGGEVSNLPFLGDVKLKVYDSGKELPLLALS
jgi:ABC-type multidrug transport system fused ATPase/permease subunit